MEWALAGQFCHFFSFILIYFQNLGTTKVLILQTLNKSMATCFQTSVNSRDKTWRVLLVAVFSKAM